MVVVNDIGMAAYFKVVKAIPYAEIPKKVNEGRKFVFTFDIEPETFTQLKVEYLNSTFRSYDSEVKELKRTLNSPA